MTEERPSTHRPEDCIPSYGEVEALLTEHFGDISQLEEKFKHTQVWFEGYGLLISSVVFIYLVVLFSALVHDEQMPRLVGLVPITIAVALLDIARKLKKGEEQLENIQQDVLWQELPFDKVKTLFLYWRYNLSNNTEAEAINTPDWLKVAIASILSKDMYWIETKIQPEPRELEQLERWSSKTLGRLSFEDISLVP